MTISIDSFSTSSASPLEQGQKNGVAVHEIAGANTAFVQATGKYADSYAYTMLVEATDLALLQSYNDDPMTSRVFSDTVEGISGVSVKIIEFGKKEVAPGLWQVSIALQKV